MTTPKNKSEPRGRHHVEVHRTDHIGWLRAAVLGANDGIVSMSSLLVGVAAASIGEGGLLVTGVAALVSGAMSMAAGEYVSVSSQSDTERADLAREHAELSTQPEHEHAELAAIYVTRGLSPELAREVAKALMVHDALAAHARDELGLSDTVSARPTQAALTSALSFASGGLFPLLFTILTPARWVVPVVAISSLVLLTALGALAARVGGAAAGKAALRVGLLGSMAMALSVAVGSLFGAGP
jgi:VIT1/CCC1 family predicted Fe2+/Mn2+ transporter